MNIHTLGQLQFLVIEENLSRKRRPKQFLGRLLVAASAFGPCSLLGSQPATPLVSNCSKDTGGLDEEITEIQQRLLQQEYLQGMSKTFQGTIATVNFHPAQP